MVAGADRTLIPFLANLRAGRAADLTSGPAPSYRSSSPPRLELLKSAGYRLQWQRNCGVDGASVVTLDQSPLVDLEPGAIHPSGLSFLCLPPRWWVAQETARLRADPAQYQVLWAQCQALGITEANRPAVERLLAIPLTLTVESMLDLVPQAAYFAAYLDRRTLRPLIQDRAFDLQLYLAALHQGIASLSQTPASLQRHQSYYNASGPDPADPWWWARHAHYADFQEVGTTAIGLLPGVACTTTGLLSLSAGGGPISSGGARRPPSPPPPAGGVRGGGHPPSPARSGPGPPLPSRSPSSPPPGVPRRRLASRPPLRPGWTAGRSNRSIWSASGPRSGRG